MKLSNNRQKEIWRDARDKMEKIIALLLYGYFSYTQLTFFLAHARISSFLITIFGLTFIIMILCRPPAKGFSISTYDWMISFSGMLVPLLLRPAPMAHDTIPFFITQVLGQCISATGLISLNRSFGIVAANHGIKTGGMYSFIRHPIYLGYFISIGSYVAQNATASNMGIFIIWTFFQVLRIVAEEDFLSLDPTYVEYKRKVRWRLIPPIW